MIAANVAPEEIARHIYVSNVDLIRNCDAVLANMTPFRGDIEPDSGTVFEVGMAIAMGVMMAAALSFIVQEPRGIMASLRAKSRDSSWWM